MPPRALPSAAGVWNESVAAELDGDLDFVDFHRRVLEEGGIGARAVGSITLG